MKLSEFLEGAWDDEIGVAKPFVRRSTVPRSPYFFVVTLDELGARPRLISINYTINRLADDIPRLLEAYNDDVIIRALDMMLNAGVGRLIEAMRELLDNRDEAQ